MFSNILVVCVGNVCRSPMAEYLLQQRLEANGMKVSVNSVGLGALVDQPAEEYTLEVMHDNGFDISSHRAKQLSDDLVRQNELILVMEIWQQKEIESLYPYARGRVHLLGKWSTVEIEDPYKKSKGEFVMAFNEIDQMCQQWCEKLC